MAAHLKAMVCPILATASLKVETSLGGLSKMRNEDVNLKKRLLGFEIKHESEYYQPTQLLLQQQQFRYDHVLYIDKVQNGVV